NHTTFTAPYTDSYQEVSFLISGFGGDSVSLISGLDPNSWQGIETKLQDNDGDGLFDRLFFNAAINAGNWNGSSLWYDLATPIASGRMRLHFDNAGDRAVVTISSAAGTEVFYGDGILAMPWGPYTGQSFGLASFGDSFMDDWEAGIVSNGPVYTASNVIVGQVATFEVNGATAGGTVMLGWSTTGAGPTNTVYGTVSMSAPIGKLAQLTANAVGVASFQAVVPASAAGKTLYTQGVDVGSLTLTNALVIAIP
ncbi:MAG: hypothetical protein O3A20_03485, partial [Planctomycetota bacterium]|nr:hypothetical protein [Planctomycetota bacterium]